MRYYVLCFSDYADVSPHIIAEVVRDGPADDRGTTLAAALAGERAVIATRAELSADPVGREALEAWDSHDDTEFNKETTAILADGTARGPLQRVHVASDADGRRFERRIPISPHHREVLYQARGLRAVTRSLVERAREQRAAHSVRADHPTLVRTQP
jgi:hypothetical protein